MFLKEKSLNYQYLIEIHHKLWAIFYSMITFYRDYGKIREKRGKKIVNMQLKGTVIRSRKAKKEKENVITNVRHLLYLQ